MRRLRRKSTARNRLRKSILKKRKGRNFGFDLFFTLKILSIFKKPIKIIENMPTRLTKGGKNGMIKAWKNKWNSMKKLQKI